MRDIRTWTHQENIDETIAALQMSDEELAADDPTYEPLGETRKAELIARLQSERED